jgi:FAD/FMN-containing dehydrogenase
MSPTLRKRNGTIIGDAVVEPFKSGFHGEVLLPREAGYDAARRLWNARIDRQPGLIARCVDVPDVARAVMFARENDVLVAVKGGGHGVAGWAICDDGIVIDLSMMNSVSVDPELRTVRAQAGALLGDVDRETSKYGLAVPTGVHPKVGIAGLTLGGGGGWLTRKYGYTCDNLLACEVITADGRIVAADEHTNSDLFWGLRGGGGNLGIVTSLLFQAHPVSTVLGGIVIYSRDQAGAVLRNYRDFMATAPDELTASAGLITAEGVPVIAVMICYCGDVDEGARVLKPLRDFGKPVADMIAPMPFSAIQTIAADANPDGIHNYWQSTVMDTLCDEAIEMIVEHSDRSESPLSLTLIQAIGGAVARVDAGATAFPHRQARYNVGIEAKWVEAAVSKKHIAWATGFSDAIRPYSGNASLVNFLGESNPDIVRRAFGSNYARMVELKTKYDPTNLFSLNQNVEPQR